MTHGPEPLATVSRLLDVTNRHDVEGIVACFSPTYRNETPVHPLRGFTGNEQVRRNWTAILAGVPDLVAEITAGAVDGDTAWTEWRMLGTRRDGTAHEMAGVLILTVGSDGLIAAARFYLEPVERDSGDIDSAVAQQLTQQPATR
jgi:hypothetical protein